MKVLFIDTVHALLQEKLEANNFICIDGSNMSREEVESTLHDVNGIVIRSRFTMDENLLKFAPNLQFIARSGAGMENIDEAYCKQRKIELFNAPEGNRTAVGEQALGMLLNLFNHLVRGNEEVRKGIWDREGNRGIELTGKTVGIIGYGNNGSAFAKVLRGFDCTILAHDKYRTNFGDDYVQEASMETIFDQADIVSFHIPQNEETLYMGNTSFFDSFKKSIYLLNLSRGKIVSIADLMKAIESNKVLGAGLDVLEFESKSFEKMDIASHPIMQTLFNNNKVLLSPHVGGWTKESYIKLSEVLAQKILSKFKV